MIQINRDSCDDCGACVSVCPYNASRITESLEIDPHTCTSCGQCVVVCPFGALHQEKEKKTNEPK